MADVRVDMPERARGQSWGPRLVVDGAEIKELRDFSLLFPVDGVATLKLEAFVEREFRIAVEARVDLTLYVQPGWWLIEEPLPFGRRLFRAAKEPAGPTSVPGGRQAENGLASGGAGALASNGAGVATIRDALELARRPHDHCDDSWYCCPACDSSDHDTNAPEHRGGSYRSRPRDDTPVDVTCHCGADAVNARIDAALALVEPTRTTVTGAPRLPDGLKRAPLRLVLEHLARYARDVAQDDDAAEIIHDAALRADSPGDV